jgi:hypothetical protein
MSPIRKINVILMLVATTISLGIIASGIPASQFRNFLLTANWFIWALFVASYPFSVLQSGVVTGTQPSSRSYRAHAPARFWTGLVATTMFWLAILVTISLFSLMAWYRGA